MESPKKSFIYKYSLMLLIIAGFITTFISGYFASRLISGQSITNSSNNPKETVRNTPPKSEVVTGNHYFVDTLIAVTIDAPHIVLTATSSRKETKEGYDQQNRVSYFNGETWTRKSIDNHTKNGEIMSDDLIKEWSIVIDPSRVLKQSVKGTAAINEDTVVFSVSNLENEIGMRSLPGYTKFMSQKEGKLLVNNKLHAAHILYTRIYSLNVNDIQFYDQPIGFTTNWVAFWDDKGNFYHVDMSVVDKPTEIYDTHQIGVMVDSKNTVYKTFSTNVSIEDEKQNIYKVTLQSPLNRSIVYKVLNKLDKAPSNDYEWYMGTIEGVDQNGVGLMEYIHN